MNIKLTSKGSYWGDGTTFRPERFLDEAGKCRKDERLIPFGVGKAVFSVSHSMLSRSSSVPGRDPGQGRAVPVLHRHPPAVPDWAGG